MNIEKLPDPPGKFGTRHIQMIVMSVTLVIAYGMRQSISIGVVAMTNKNTHDDFKVYDWSAGQKGLILSSFYWGYASTQIPSGHVASIWSARKFVTIGLFLSSIITLTTPFVADYGYIAVIAGRILIGFTQSCLLPSIHMLTSKWSPPIERSRISAFISSGNSLGVVVAMALSGVIADSSLGWPGIFYIFGCAGASMSIIFYFTIADNPTLHPSISEDEKNYIADSLRCVEHEKEKPRPPWRKIMTSLPMWAIIFAHMGTNWGNYTLQTEIPEYVKSVLKFKMTGNGLISSLYFVAAWAMCFPFSWLTDYAVIKGMSVKMARQIVNSIALWGSAFVFIILCYVDTLGQIWPVAMLILAGGLKAGTTSGFHVNHIDVSPNFAGAMYSVSNGFSTLVTMIAPIACSAITQGTKDPGPWHTVFYITAGVYILTNLIYVLLAEGETQSWNEKVAKNIPDPIKRLSVISLNDTKILASVP